MYRDALDVFRKAGAKLEPIAMPDFPTGSIGFVLSAEAAAAFDDLTRDKDKLATLTGAVTGRLAQHLPQLALHSRRRIHPRHAGAAAADAGDGQADVAVRRLPEPGAGQRPACRSPT